MSYSSSHSGSWIDDAVYKVASQYVTPGVASSSAALVLDASKNIIGINNMTIEELTIASSSILYSSGSTIFGDDGTDTHQFTGSVSIQSGSITLGDPFGSATSLSINMGKSGSGWYENGSSEVVYVINGNIMATSTEDYFGGVTGNKFYIDWKYPASSTNPVWSFRGSGTSGIGLADYDKTSLIASGSEIARITTQSFEHKHSVSYPTTEVSESYELRPIDYYVDVDTDPTSCSIQLFDASLVPNGWTSNIGDVAFSASVNPITIIASSSQLINNSASASLTGDGDAATLKSNGTEAWYIR